MGLAIVKFNDDATRDHVLENGILQFDRKPVIIRPWSADLSVVRLVRSVPLWIRLHDLGLQYWGSKCLSALVSTIGKPIMVDKFTREHSRIQFDRVLVEMEVTDNPPRSIQFLNELGQIMEQGVEYEWLPIKCKTCSGFGHSVMDCRKELKTQWVKKDPTTKEELKNRMNTGEIEPTGIEPAVLTSTKMERVQVINIELEGVQVINTEGSQPNSLDRTDEDKGTQNSKNWLTPKRVATHSKQGQVANSNVKISGQGQQKMNKFEVLQEQMIGGKEDTKMKGNKIIEFMEQKLPNWEFFTSSVTEGRILIVWRKVFVRVTILEKSNQFVHYLVKMVGQNQVFYVTFVYGLNSIDGRRSLWEGLQRLSLLDEAWIILGDFNAPFSSMDKSGGKPI
ncbi:uncharacterized protein LOC133824147 [Humulus lupulus]|uniref:uncharacterized protein LOC133824147 n=1 Tax=Humulus lupulus TaxID=3486 RepID=UPI002B41697B|nr:uncharacterized protein LOC133824147 [Humulus lupulus]